jgi:hypothetical protein
MLAFGKPPDYTSRVQREFLSPPIEQFGDIQFIFGGACHFMYPAEFFQGFAAAAEPP